MIIIDLSATKNLDRKKSLEFVMIIDLFVEVLVSSLGFNRQITHGLICFGVCQQKSLRNTIDSLICLYRYKHSLLGK